MSFELLSQIKYILTLSFCPFGMALNMILFFLIMYQSPHAMHAYKKVLYLGCIADFFHAFWFFLVEPEVATINGAIFVFSQGILGYLPFPWTAWTYPITLFFIYFSLVNTLIQFVYRYLLVSWQIRLNKWTFGMLVLFGAGIVMMYAGNLMYHLIRRINPDKYHSVSLIGTEFQDVPFYGVFPLIDFPYLLHIVIAIVIFSYLLIIYCGIAVWLRLKKDGENMSEKSKKYQKQITIVMTIEAIVPVITVVFPVTLNLIMIFAQINFPWEGKTSVLLISFAPVINPIVKILVISSFRKWILQTLKFSNSQISTVNISVNPVT